MPKIFSNLNIYHRIHVLFTIKKELVSSYRYGLSYMQSISCSKFIQNYFKLSN